MDEALKVWYLPRQAVQGQVLSGWVFAGLSCTLIKRRVLEAGIRFKYQPGIGEDILFLYDVQSRGFAAKVDGRVACGHLPEWPLPKPLTLDVGCGHEPKGDVNVDLFAEPTAHRSPDQRKCDDKPLEAKAISDFVRADASHLPFKDGAFRRVYSGHTIEHVEDPEAMIDELLRVSSCEVEITCPHAKSPWGSVACKPLHVNALRPEWFKRVLEAVPSIDFQVSCNSYGNGPGDIFVRVRKKRLTCD
jgi:SAM-dependent methyltransferase